MRKLLAYFYGLKNLRFVQDVFTIQIGSMVFMAAGFVSSVLFARVLGIDRYGLYAVTLAFAGTVGAFMNIGQGTSLYVFFSEEFGRKNRSGMAAVLRNFLNISVINLSLFLLLAFFSPWIAMRLYGNASIGGYARIFFLFQAVDMWNSMALTILQAVRHIRLKVTIEQAENVLFLTVASVSVLLGYGVKGIFVSQLAVALLTLPFALGSLFVLASTYDFPSLSEIVRVPFRKTEQYFLQGLIIALDKSIGNFFPQGLYFVLSLIASPALVGIARIAVQLSNLPRSILLPQAGDLSITAFAKMKAEGTAILRKNAARLIKHALAFHALLTAGAFATLPFIIHYFYGGAYDPAITMTLWLLLISLATSLNIANSPILRLYRKTHYSILIALLNWAAMIASLLLLAPVATPAIAFLIAYALGQLIPLLLPYYIFTSLLRAPAPA